MDLCSSPSKLGPFYSVLCPWDPLLEMDNPASGPGQAKIYFCPIINFLSFLQKAKNQKACAKNVISAKKIKLSFLVLLSFLDFFQPQFQENQSKPDFGGHFRFVRSKDACRKFRGKMYIFFDDQDYNTLEEWGLNWQQIANLVTILEE